MTAEELIKLKRKSVEWHHIELNLNRVLNNRREYKNQSLKNIRRKGIQCQHCGIKGSFFAFEKSVGRSDRHLAYRLYAYKNNRAFPMTTDHIIPRAQRGSNHMSNLQILCEPCNKKKGASIDKYAQGTYKWEEASEIEDLQKRITQAEENLKRCKRRFWKKLFSYRDFKYRRRVFPNRVNIKQLNRKIKRLRKRQEKIDARRIAHRE